MPRNQKLSPRKKSKTSERDKNFKFSLKNIRCFSSKQDFNIRPLTFLTGENSTGKTTILGCLQAVSSVLSSRRIRFDLDFNEDPYNMGSFQDIVSRAGNGIKNDSFEIGFYLEQSKKECIFTFKESDKGAEPIVQSLRLRNQARDYLFNFDKDSPKLKLESKDLFKKKTLPEGRIIYETNLPGEFVHRFFSAFLRTDFTEKIFRDKLKAGTKGINDIFEEVYILYEYITGILRGSVSLAPIRSKPKRTYDPAREVFDPEGSEIPTMLKNIFAADENLYKDLVCFGKASGLFEDVEVKSYGASKAEPFQLHFKVKKDYTNIIDVGYGVSQVIPLLVHIFLFGKNKHFLLQQPEVHLHPKAQAEFSSHLINCIKTKNHSFLIETHSDFMVDRARIEIQKGSISPDDVSLIYLENKNKEVKAHNISFDKQGNVANAPEGYRDFFSKEMDRVMGFETN